ncbi:hypothetical protein B0H11DRAFT_1941267 [Mycena galericulata]|nr:hypothetical protein B0H11DRAFT_1941267 [Mycena galericulata]
MKLKIGGEFSVYPRVHRIPRLAAKVTHDSRLMDVRFSAVTIFASSDAEFIALDTFPAVIGIANLLTHARVGLGCVAGVAGVARGAYRAGEIRPGRKEAGESGAKMFRPTKRRLDEEDEEGEKSHTVTRRRGSHGFDLRPLFDKSPDLQNDSA